MGPVEGEVLDGAHPREAGDDRRRDGIGGARADRHEGAVLQARLQVLHGPLRDDAAARDDDDPLADLLDPGDDVGGEEDRPVPPELLDEVPDLAHLVGIEADGRLVEDEDLGIVGEDVGEADALAVALGEMADDAVRDVGDPHALEGPEDPPRPLPEGDLLQPRPEPEEVRDPHLLVEGDVLGEVPDAPPGLHGAGEDVEAGDPRLPPRGGHEAREDAEGGGLPGPVGAQEPDDLPPLDGEGDPIHRPAGTEVLHQVLDLDGGHLFGVASPGSGSAPGFGVRAFANAPYLTDDHRESGRMPGDGGRRRRRRDTGPALPCGPGPPLRAGFRHPGLGVPLARLEVPGGPPTVLNHPRLRRG